MKADKSSSLNAGLLKLGNDIRIIKMNSEDCLRDTYDEEFLSMIIDEVIKGKDIRIEFPSFFSTLERDKDLRQQFIDALMIIGGKTIPDYFSPQTNEEVNSSIISRFTETKKSLVAMMQKGSEELQDLFFPKETVFRDGKIGIESIYILFNDEIEIPPFTYSIELDGKFSEHSIETFSINVFISITEPRDIRTSGMPINLSLTWGNFSRTMTLEKEGEFYFTDVPINQFLEIEKQRVFSPLQIVITRSNM